MLSKFKSTQTEFHLNGKEINLTSDEIAIKSNNFNVDKNGNMTCSNANITGGKINVSAEVGEIIVKVYNGNNVIGITPTVIMMEDENGNYCQYSVKSFQIQDGNDETKSYAGASNFWLNGGHTYVGGDKIETPILTQTSLAENKKNFEKLENALEIIKQVDIYKYNLKNEKDTDKKHLGFVIGDGYNYSKDLTSNNNDGADIYSLASCCLAGLKEAIQQIENMQKEIEKLKGGQANG